MGKDPSGSLGFTFWQSRENTCGAFAVALLPMLTAQGKENSWSAGLQGRSIVKSWTSWKREKTHPDFNKCLVICGRFWVGSFGSSWSNKCVIPSQLGCFSLLANMEHWRTAEPLPLMQMSCSVSSTVQVRVLNHLILAHVSVRSWEQSGMFPAIELVLGSPYRVFEGLLCHHLNKLGVISISREW